MAFKFVVLATLLAAANAGLIAAPAATSYSSSSVSHAAPAYASYAAPAYKVAAPAYASYAAPAYKVAAPVAQYSYAAAPVAHYAAAPVAHYAAPIHKTIVSEQYAPAAYNFEYSVHDSHTGDIKSQKEVRQGDAVQGSYSLIEADGSRRTVEYTADDHNGFNAVVHREPAAHPVAVKTIAPLVKYAAPVAQYAAPVAHYAAAPVAHYAAAPVAHYSAGHSYANYAAPTVYHH